MALPTPPQLSIVVSKLRKRAGWPAPRTCRRENRGPSIEGRGCLAGSEWPGSGKTCRAVARCKVSAVAGKTRLVERRAGSVRGPGSDRRTHASNPRRKMVPESHLLGGQPWMMTYRRAYEDVVPWHRSSVPEKPEKPGSWCRKLD